jgi:hypothetical protein
MSQQDKLLVKILLGTSDTNIPFELLCNHFVCCLQAVDLFCWGLQRKAEKQDKVWFDCFQDKVKVNLQYFGQ